MSLSLELAQEQANRACNPCELVRCLGVRNMTRIEYICRRCGAKTMQYFTKRIDPYDYHKTIAGGSCPYGKQTVVRFDDQCPKCYLPRSEPNGEIK